MDDQRIIELLFERSESGIADLSQKYEKLCYSVARNVLDNEQDIEECVNDTYVSVWNSIPPQRPNNLRAYICRITRCISINRWKHNASQKRGGNMDLLLSELDECIPAKEDVSETIEARHTLKIIEHWLDTLDEQTQVLFVRRYVLMDSIAQLAEAFSMSESNVSTKLYRTRKKLSNYLRKEGVEI